MRLQKPPPNTLIGDCSIVSPLASIICNTAQFYETKRSNRSGDVNLDLVDAASGGEVSGAGGAGAIDLRSGETGGKRQIKRASCSFGGLGFRRRPCLRSKTGAAARVRACVRAYVRGRRGGWAGGCRASGRRAGPAGRTPSAGSAAPASSAAYCLSPLPKRNPRGGFFFFCAFPVCSAASAPFVPSPHGHQGGDDARTAAEQLATGGENDAGTGERVCSAAAARQQMAWPGSVKTASAC